jgi:peptide/nickel transport system permease protein
MPTSTLELDTTSPPAALPVANRTARLRRWLNARLVLGLILVVPLLVAGFIGPMLNLGNPLKTDPLNSLLGPGQSGHLLGTDQNGRDVLVRIIYGLRTSLIVTLCSVAIGATVGTLAGLLAGYYRRWVEQIIMRLADLILVFPTILVAIAVISFVGGSLINLIIVISILIIPVFARVIHAATLGESQRDYVDAARAMGNRNRRIILRHVLPNVSTPLFIELAILLGQVVLVEASLSFLGLGVPPPEPTLGNMVSSARGYMFNAPWLLVWPSLVLAALVIGFNLLVDGLRDLLDPRLRSGK